MAKKTLVEKKQPIDGYKKPYGEPRFWRFGKLCDLTTGGSGTGENYIGNPPKWEPWNKGHS